MYLFMNYNKLDHKKKFNHVFKPQNVSPQTQRMQGKPLVYTVLALRQFSATFQGMRNKV